MLYGENGRSQGSKLQRANGPRQIWVCCLLCAGDAVESPVAREEEGSLLIKIKGPICFIISESSSARWLAEVLHGRMHYRKQISQQDKRMPVQMNLPYFHPWITAALRRLKYIMLPLQRLPPRNGSDSYFKLDASGKLCSSFPSSLLWPVHTCVELHMCVR